MKPEEPPKGVSKSGAVLVLLHLVHHGPDNEKGFLEAGGVTMKRTCVVLLLVLFAVFGFSGVGGATLTTIGTAKYNSIDYNLIFEGELGGSGLVWLDYAKNTAFWPEQVNWAAGLNASLTYNLDPTISFTWNGDWRLPSAGPNPQAGYNQMTSEMGHLYYVSLGRPARGPLGDTTPFDNLTAYMYWSGTEGYPEGAWKFNFWDGWQDAVNKNGWYCNALAVRPAEVESVPIPEPASMLLFGSGLLAWVGLRRRFKK